MSQPSVGRRTTTGPRRVASTLAATSAVLLSLTTGPASAQPIGPDDPRLQNLTGPQAVALGAQLRTVGAVQSADEKCTLGFIYAHATDLPNLALAHYFLSACFVAEGAVPPIFATTHADQLDAMYRRVAHRLQASPWSEITLTSNVSGERIALAGWADTDLRSPVSLWLPAGTYSAVFSGEPQSKIANLTREFVVAKSQRGVVMVEHYIPAPTSQGPGKTVSVDFAEDQPEAGSPTVIIDNKHKNLVPDRFLRKSQALDSSQTIEDPLARQPHVIVGPGAWTVGLAAGFGAHFDATARTRLGAGAAVVANVAVSKHLALDIRSGFASTGGSDTMDRTANAWSLAGGVRWQFTEAQRQSAWHPFVGTQLGCELRVGMRDAASLGATLAGEAGMMVGPAQRFGVAIAVIHGLTALEQSAATGVSLQVRARVW
ncbi:MAG: hypothetical protein KBG15_00790 [Kofleriaceae bacterium]|nr:hypothetical protein [Kofleriaceae bacterium]